jgi:hypothetical protein
MTCALAAPTHNAIPHIATNKRFLMDIKTSGICLRSTTAYTKLPLCCDGLVATSSQESSKRRLIIKLTYVISERPQWWHILR